MKICKTAKINLEAKVEDFLPTVKAYTEAFNFVCQIGYQNNEHNSINLHKLTYLQVKAKFWLTYQLTYAAPEIGKCRKIKLNADLNAARNISSRASKGLRPIDGAEVNRPFVSEEMSDTSSRL